MKRLRYSSNIQGLCLTAAEEPSSVEEAMRSTPWKEAMDAEMESIRENTSRRTQGP